MESAQSILIEYLGPNLTPRTEYDWTVTVWDNHGETADGTSRFETGLLSRAFAAASLCALPGNACRRIAAGKNQNLTCHKIFHQNQNRQAADQNGLPVFVLRPGFRGAPRKCVCGYPNATSAKHVPAQSGGQSNPIFLQIHALLGVNPFRFTFQAPHPYVPDTATALCGLCQAGGQRRRGCRCGRRRLAARPR